MTHPIKIKVILTTEEGEVLDQFLAASFQEPAPMPAALAAKVRDILEMRYEVEDT